MSKDKILDICKEIDGEVNISTGIAMGVHNLEDAELSLLQIASNLQSILEYTRQIREELDKE